MASTTADLRVRQSNVPDHVYSPIIRVVVGDTDNQREFFVHESLVCPRSDFFQSAMNGPWKDSEERMVPLPEDEPEVFSLYLSLLKTNELAIEHNLDSPTELITVVEEYPTMAKLFVLAEKLMDDAAKGEVLAAIAARAKEPFVDGNLYYPEMDTIQIIYNGTPEGSPARVLLTGLYTNFIKTTSDIKANDEAPKDFFRDLALSLLVNRPLATEYDNLKGVLTAAEDKLEQAEQNIEDLESKVYRLKENDRRRYHP